MTYLARRSLFMRYWQGRWRHHSYLARALPLATCINLTHWGDRREERSMWASASCCSQLRSAWAATNSSSFLSPSTVRWCCCCSPWICTCRAAGELTVGISWVVLTLKAVVILIISCFWIVFCSSSSARDVVYCLLSLWLWCAVSLVCVHSWIAYKCYCCYSFFLFVWFVRPVCWTSLYIHLISLLACNHIFMLCLCSTQHRLSFD